MLVSFPCGRRHAIVQGFGKANRMVDIRKTLNEKQIDALVQFLMDMKPQE